MAEAIDAEVHSILVEGVDHTSNEELFQALSLTKGASLVGFDTEAARRRLENLPWVRDAVVNRSLPSTVRVDIFEHKPIARIIDEETQDIWVVNSEGSRISLDENRAFSVLPLIKGKSSALHAAELIALLKQTEFYSKVKAAVFVGERRWNLGFDGDMWVQLPENGALEALSLLAELEKRKQVLSVKGGMVDLRLTDRVIFRMPPKSKAKQGRVL